MRFLTRLAVLFYVTIISAGAVVVVLLAQNQININYVLGIVDLIYNDQQFGTAVSVVSLAIMLMSIMLARIIATRQRKERSIAFENESGPVSVSLAAVEDLIRRVISSSPEVKEVRPHIIATKKGLEVTIRLTLRSDVNIPDMTNRLQQSIRSRIQESIGIEDNIDIGIHVVKIVSDQLKPKDKKKSKGPEDAVGSETAEVPFHGYRK